MNNNLPAKPGPAYQVLRDETMNTALDRVASMPEPKYLSTAGLLSYLKEFAGFAPSRSSLYKLTMDGQIPFIKGPGNRLLFPIAEIRKWVENGGQMEG